MQSLCVARHIGAAQGAGMSSGSTIHERPEIPKLRLRKGYELFWNLVTDGSIKVNLIIDPIHHRRHRYQTRDQLTHSIKLKLLR
jgi:hypothetical protein